MIEPQRSRRALAVHLAGESRAYKTRTICTPYVLVADPNNHGLLFNRSGAGKSNTTQIGL